MLVSQSPENLLPFVKILSSRSSLLDLKSCSLNMLSRDKKERDRSFTDDFSCLEYEFSGL